MPPLPSNDKFLMSTLAIDAKPINANECVAIQSLDLPAIPNSIPAKYIITFQMNDGNTYRWTYTDSVNRDFEFSSIQQVVTTTV